MIFPVFIVILSLAVSANAFIIKRGPEIISWDSHLWPTLHRIRQAKFPLVNTVNMYIQTRNAPARGSVLNSMDKNYVIDELTTTRPISGELLDKYNLNRRHIEEDAIKDIIFLKDNIMNEINGVGNEESVKHIIDEEMNENFDNPDFWWR